ncbi:MAG: efflux RND transporter periplasmic adaptor subunit [Nitrospinota bacterium]
MQKRKKTVSQKILKILLIIFILSAAGVGGYLYYRKTTVIPVQTKKATRRLFLYTVTSTSSGTIKADRAAKISSRINGRVIRVGFNEGDMVKAGEELIVLETEEASANIKMVEANLSLAKVRYEQAKAAFEVEKKLVNLRIQETEANRKEASAALRRAQDMMRQGIISDQQMDTTLRNYDVAHAVYESALASKEGVVLKEKEMLAAKTEVEHLEESLRIAVIQKDYLKIAAPFNGIISFKQVEVGEMVLPGVALTEIVDNNSLYVHAPVDEADIHKIHEGQEVKITVDAFPDAEFIGKIYEISPIVSEDKLEGRTVTIKVSIDQHKEKLRPGMSCDVEILIDKIPDALLVPTNLLMGRGEKRYVFVVENGSVKKRYLRLGLSNWDFTVVEDGLREGEEIISSIDILNLKDGSRVVVKNE